MSGISNSKRTLSSLEIADGLYGSAFNASSREDVGSAMNDWIELSEAERGFALGQLLYLNLQVQTENGRLLRRAVRELEELNDGVQELVDDYFSADDDPDDDDNAEGEPTDDDTADDDTADDESGNSESGNDEMSLDAPVADALSRDSEPSEDGLTGHAITTTAVGSSLESAARNGMDADAMALLSPDSATFIALDHSPVSAGRNS